MVIVVESWIIQRVCSCGSSPSLVFGGEVYRTPQRLSTTVRLPSRGMVKRVEPDAFIIRSITLGSNTR